MARRLIEIRVIALVFLLSSCVQVPEPQELPNQFSGQGQSILQPDWWLTFNNAGLTSAINTTLTGNLNLLAASYEVDLWGRVRSRAEAAVPDTEGRRPVS